MLKFDHGPEPTAPLMGIVTSGASDSGSWPAGLGVVGGTGSAGWARARDYVDGEVAFEEVFEFGAVDEGDAVTLSELFARSAEPGRLQVPGSCGWSGCDRLGRLTGQARAS
jgi:hypothetical protein